jgi:integrase
VRGKLNAARLRTLIEPGTYADGAGLYLQVRGPDQRSWLYRYKLHGRDRWMGLGATADVPLAEAREQAQAARRQVRAGIDPISQRKQQRSGPASLSFDTVADAYAAAHAAGWRTAKHARQWRHSLTAYVTPVFGMLPVATIDVGLVMQAVEPIWATKTATASRVRGRIEAVLDYAKARGWRSGENPARWRGHLDHLLPAYARTHTVRHFAALPWTEIGEFMAALEGEQGMTPLALRFLILTAARTGEVLKARWSEIDIESATWTIPAPRTKTRREHRVPLSAPAMRLLLELQPLRTVTRGDWVFPGLKDGMSLSPNALLALLRRLRRNDLTAHGFRSTFRSWCAEATNYPREVAEAALAHVSGDQTERAYQRSDLFERRRRLMEEWATVCTRPAAIAEVVPLHRTVR